MVYYRLRPTGPPYIKSLYVENNKEGGPGRNPGPPLVFVSQSTILLVFFHPDNCRAVNDDVIAVPSGPLAICRYKLLIR